MSSRRNAAAASEKSGSTSISFDTNNRAAGDSSSQSSFSPRASTTSTVSSYSPFANADATTERSRQSDESAAEPMTAAATRDGTLQEATSRSELTLRNGKKRTVAQSGLEDPVSTGEEDQQSALRNTRSLTVQTASYPLSSSASEGQKGRVDSSTASVEAVRNAGICLCQPEPKIPRPRNAFILYRQFHHASISSDKPGLANPEISKVIGEQWKKEPAEEKNRWKTLAEEEKLRHRQQYPDYRYQPRRAGRRGSTELLSSPVVDRHHCPKCGGKSITSPADPQSSVLTPSTPLTANFTSGSAQGPGYLPMLRHLSLNSPQPRQNGFHQGRPMANGPSNLHMAPLRENEHEMEYPAGVLSPDVKRRRFDRGAANPYRANAGGPIRFGDRTTYSVMTQDRRLSFPRTDQVLRTVAIPTAQHRFMRPPSPRSALIQGGPPNDGAFRTHSRSASANFDSSLILPPLQTGRRVSEESRSPRSMVKSMSYLSKVMVLSMVAPPPKTIPARRRGAIVAVEADDPHAAAVLVGWLEKFLEQQGDAFNVQQVDGPHLPTESDSRSKDASSSVSLEQYLSRVCEWHGKSRDILKFINGSSPISETSRKPSTSSHTFSDLISNGDTAMSGQDNNNSNHDDDETPTPTRASHSRVAERHDSHSEQLSGSPTAAAVNDKSGIPTVIIKQYHLGATDAYTASIPIGDSYSVTDHWQWIATLWRGTPGPDLTVYIRDVAPTTSTSSPSPPRDQHQQDGPEEHGGNAQEGPKRLTVEVLEQQRTVVIRRERDAADSMAVDGGSGAVEATGLSERTLRRVGFEVGEWVRNIAA